MDKFGEDSTGGHPQVPAVGLRSTAKVTPTGVGIRVAFQPRYWGCLQTSITGIAGGLYYGPLPRPLIWNTRDRGHTHTCEAGGPGPPGSDENVP